MIQLGQLLATPGALKALAQAGTNGQDLIERHRNGDWGDLCPEDKQWNDDAVRDGSRVLSAYILPTHEKVWIITEWDRSRTTLLLPEEY